MSKDRSLHPSKTGNKFIRETGKEREKKKVPKVLHMLLQNIEGIKEVKKKKKRLNH